MDSLWGCQTDCFRVVRLIALRPLFGCYVVRLTASKLSGWLPYSWVIQWCQVHTTLTPALESCTCVTAHGTGYANRPVGRYSNNSAQTISQKGVWKCRLPDINPIHPGIRVLTSYCFVWRAFSLRHYLVGTRDIAATFTNAVIFLLGRFQSTAIHIVWAPLVQVLI